MSYWLALAKVERIADADLRERLADALETIDEIARALDVSANEILDEIEGIKASAKEAEAGRDRAEGRLEEKLQEEGSVEERLAAVAKERDELAARLVDPAGGIVEAYSDMLAMARKFVSRADAVRKPTRHVREVRRQKKT